MATTTNYSWTTPDDTALVKDGASAIRTLGSSIDTTTKALNPSTTLGDVEYRSSTANTNTRLGIGTTGQVLTVSGGVPAWTTLASGSGLTKIVTANFSAAATVGINQCFTSTYVNYIIVLNAFGMNAQGQLYMRFQTGTNTVVSSGDYYGSGWSAKNDNTTSQFSNSGSTAFTLAPIVATNLRQNFTINISNVGNSSQDGNISSLGNGSGNGIATYAGIINAAATYTGVQFLGDGNLTGTYTVYGLAK